MRYERACSSPQLIKELTVRGQANALPMRDATQKISFNMMRVMFCTVCHTERAFTNR